MKQEKFGFAQSAQGQAQTLVSQPAQNNVNKPPTSIPAVQSHPNTRNDDPAALNFMSTTVSLRAATAISTRAQVQATLLNKAPYPLNKEVVVPENTLRQQVQDTSKLLVNQDLIALQKRKLNGRFVNDILENDQIEDRALCFSKNLARRDSDDDVNMEDIPLSKCTASQCLRLSGFC